MSRRGSGRHPNTGMTEAEFNARWDDQAARQDPAYWDRATFGDVANAARHGSESAADALWFAAMRQAS